MKWTADDYEYMAQALRLARLGQYSCQPNPRVGCLVVRDKRIIGEGSHLKSGEEHAEIAALKQAGPDARGSSCYITLEPCVHTGKTSPCTDALINAGVGKVIAAMVDPNPKVNGQGLERLKQAGIETEYGLLEEQAYDLNRGFYRRMNSGMPFVRCKLAMSLDGKTALESGKSKWITGAAARHDVQKLRAESCAIMTGIGTVLEDNPNLTVRDIDTRGRKPLRVILDRRLRIPPESNVLNEDAKTIVFATFGYEQRMEKLAREGVQVRCLDDDQDFLKNCLHILAVEMEVNEVMLESGAGLAGAMLENGLLDELVIYQAPVILGDKASGLLSFRKIEDLQEAYNIEFKDIRNVGSDIRYTCELVKQSM